MITRRNNSVCSFETLEERQMMTVLPTDMTQLAKQYPTHVGATELYLNFDGGSINDTQAGGKVTVSAFTAAPGKNLQQSIQDIVYRVSEIYAPFNVQVRRLSGAGNYATTDGASTIFIGGNAANSITSNNVTTKVTGSSTAWASADYPGPTKGITHAPNGDDYDLGFVDPVSANGSSGNATTLSDLNIADNIAHESGHTFGLAHVLTSPTNDIMSYDSGNRFFANQTFNITTQNFVASTGKTTATANAQPIAQGTVSGPFGTTFFEPSVITTQNSYTYLGAVLGQLNLKLDAYPHHVADPGAVDPSYFNSIGSGPKALGIGSSFKGFADLGSGDVFTISNNYSVPERETVKVTAGKGLNSQMLFYDSSGYTQIDAYHGSSHTVTIPAYTTETLVVGGFEGNSYGKYTVAVSSPFSNKPIKSRLTSDSAAVVGGSTISNSKLGSLVNGRSDSRLTNLKDLAI